MKAQIILCTYTKNEKGGTMLSTRYSCWDEQEFKTLDEARAFGRGVVCGLRYKWQKAACTLRFDDGHEEYFID